MKITKLMDANWNGEMENHWVYVWNGPICNAHHVANLCKRNWKRVHESYMNMNNRVVSVYGQSVIPF